MYLSNRLPLANYEVKGRKNQTVKLSKSLAGIKSKHYIMIQDAAARVQRNAHEAQLEGDLSLPNVSNGTESMQKQP